MAVLTQSYGAGEALTYDLPYYSRDEVIIASGQNLPANSVLGKVAPEAAAVAGGGNTGNGTIGSVTAASSARPGTYTLTLTAAAANGGTFAFADPAGASLGNVIVGTEYKGAGLTFTVADGSTDFIVGDTFTVGVTGGTYKEWNPANSDGTETVAGVLIPAVDASAGEVSAAAVVRHASVNAAELSYFTGANEGAKRNALSQLAALGITS